jgi:hypothetical protein
MNARSRATAITRNFPSTGPTARRSNQPLPSAFARNVPGCTGKNEDDDPGGKKGPNKNDDEITKPGCK